MSVRSFQHQMTASISDRRGMSVVEDIESRIVALGTVPKGPPDQAGFISPNRADAPIPLGP